MTTYQARMTSRPWTRASRTPMRQVPMTKSLPPTRAMATSIRRAHLHMVIDVWMTRNRSRSCSLAATFTTMMPNRHSDRAVR